MKSYWSIPDIDSIKTPASILKEQAAALSDGTHGLLQGLVKVHQIDDQSQTLVRMSIITPKLNNYRFKLLEYYQPVSMYPGELIIPYLEKSWQIVGENEFLSVLEKALSSEPTRNLLASLMAQARDSN